MRIVSRCIECSKEWYSYTMKKVDNKMKTSICASCRSHKLNNDFKKKGELSPTLKNMPQHIWEDISGAVIRKYKKKTENKQ